MKYLVFTARVTLLLVLFEAYPYSAHAQTTVGDLDDDPITNPPTDTYNNNRSWSWETGTDIGCNPTGCHASGSINTNGSPNIDENSIQFNLFTIDGCSRRCWSDALFFNRIYHDGTADGATSFTFDLYNTVNANVSQALEYTVEQDVFNGWNYTKYVYSYQCDYADGIWRVWDGNLNGGGADWVNPNGANIPCVPFQPAGEFAHFTFDFQSPDPNHMYYSDFTVNTTNRHVNYTAGVTVVSNWEENLITELQLDGNYFGDNYTATSDLWTVTYQ